MFVRTFELSGNTVSINTITQLLSTYILKAGSWARTKTNNILKLVLVALKKVKCSREACTSHPSVPIARVPILVAWMAETTRSMFVLLRFRTRNPANLIWDCKPVRSYKSLQIQGSTQKQNGLLFSHLHPSASFRGQRVFIFQLHLTVLQQASSCFIRSARHHIADNMVGKNVTK